MDYDDESFFLFCRLRLLLLRLIPDLILVILYSFTSTFLDAKISNSYLITGALQREVVSARHGYVSHLEPNLDDGVHEGKRMALFFYIIKSQ